MAKKQLSKLKTHRGAAKRLKRAAGPIKFRRANRSHCNTGMSSMLKRSLRRPGRMEKPNLNAVKHLLLY